MVTFKELKDICNQADGNIFCDDGVHELDEVGQYYVEIETEIEGRKPYVVLDLSDGWDDDWVHESAKEAVSNLCDKHNECSCAEDDYEVIAEYGGYYEIDRVYIHNGNIICNVGKQIS